MDIVYLDWAATSIPDFDIISSVSDFNTQYFGNPSSIHAFGLESSKKLASFRQSMARILNCNSNQVIFTSGGSESNNMVLRSFLNRKKKPKIIISGIEHASIYETAKILKHLDFQVVIVNPGKGGTFAPEILLKELDETTALVSVMLVNNETGIIEPIAELVKVVRDFEKRSGKPIHFHTDAVQAFGKIPIDLPFLDVDSASFSAHKIGAPRGIGMLYTKKEIFPLITGGGQEMGARGGTENLPGIYGFVLSALKRMENLEKERRRAAELKSILITRLSAMEGAVVMEKEYGDTEYSPYITTIFFPPVPGEILVRVLSDRGIFVSSGSACSTKKKKKTRVLESMGIPLKYSSSALRVSTGHSTTKTQITQFCDILESEIKLLRKTIA